MGRDGVMCLANDAVLDSLIALCESLRTHSPALPMTVIPYDEAIEQTRAMAAGYGYDVYDDPSLLEMDALATRYMGGKSNPLGLMRKLCAFWGPYERCMFLDADVIVLRPLEPYFEAFRGSGADFMYFATDMTQVYRPGPVREEMLSRYGTAAFNSGTYLARRGVVNAERVEQVRQASAAHRRGFINRLDQTFVNYVVDVCGLVKVDAHDLVPSMVEAGAGMRLTRRDGKLVLADARTPESGRPVSMIHWAGYHVRPCMPYRRIFLSYRLAGRSRRYQYGYRLRSLGEAASKTSWRTPVRLVKRWRVLGRNVLASRGYIGWP